MNNKLSPALNLLRRLKNYLILILTLFVISCNGQDQTKSVVDETETVSSNQIRIKEKKEINFDIGVYCGYLDSKGILWFGSNGNGLYRYDGTTFTQYIEEKGLSNNQVLSIIEDKENKLWFGTANGMWKYDRKTFTHVAIPFSDTTSVWLDKVYPIINPNAVHSLAQDKNGDIWIGTGGAGAYRYDGEKFTSFLTEHGRKQEDSLYHNWITSIAEDDDGNIWFSSMTRGGASRFDGENFTHFMPKDGLFTDMVRTIFKDKTGIVWFGYKATRDGGLTRYDGNSFVNYYKKDGLCNHSIRTMFEDKNGNLWLGGDLNNLCVYDGKNFKEYKTKDNKKFDGILTILKDATGNIWFGGKNGLWKFDGKTVTDMTK